MTIEQLWDLDPEPDPEPLPKRPRRLPDDDPGLGERQYEAYLDRLGEPPC